MDSTRRNFFVMQISMMFIIGMAVLVFQRLVEVFKNMGLA
jgi:hypothetical protein